MKLKHLYIKYVCLCIYTALTTGIVSGLGREVRSPNNKPIQNVIQTG